MKRIKKTDKMKKIEALLGVELIEFFRLEYEKNKLTYRQISAKLFKLTGLEILPGTLSRWFNILGIKIRKQVWK